MNLLKVCILPVLFWFLAMVYDAPAQTAERGFQLLAQEKYALAIDAFNKAIEKNKDLLASKFGLALAFANKSYEKFRYDRAFRNLVFVEKRYDKLTGSEKSILNKDFSIDDIRIGRLKEQILNEALAEAKNDGSIAAFTKFCEDYPNTEHSHLARKIIEDLNYSKAVVSSDPIALSEFIAKNPNSIHADSARLLLRKLEIEAYSRYSADGELEMLMKFKQLYPNFIDQQRLQNDVELAEFAFKLGLDESYSVGMESIYLDYIVKAAPKELAFVALIRTIAPFLEKKEWSTAYKRLQDYKHLFPHDFRLDKICQIIQASDRVVVMENFSDQINTQGHEYAPVLTPDSKTLYFCGRGRAGNIGGEDIFVSKFKDGSWSRPELLKSINTPYAHEAPLAISADGNRLLIYANTDIYFTEKTHSGWSFPRPFPSINNPESWEADAYMTADGNAILFISDRQGNIGGHHRFGDPFHGSHSGNSDIYVSTRNESGGWSAPVNLGTTINTPYSERSPFLHPDMKTLYFSSEGHPGLGRLDVFKSIRLSDTLWTSWSEPVNLGKEINSYGDEYDYKISTDGRSAYFSSFKTGHYDIMKLTIPETVRPEYVATIWGKITDRNGKAIQTQIKWEDLKEGKTIGLLQSDLAEGNYLIILPLGKNYGYFIDDPNYYPLSGNIDLTGKNEEITIRKDFVLFSNVEIINDGVAVPLENVFFEFNKYSLKKESFSELNRLYAFLAKHQNLRIEIAGHTDNIGSADHNKKLSEQRAHAVMDYLLKKGVSAQAMLAKGYGPDMPIDDNKTESGRAKNRRVEFKVIQK
jgi:outer membrane protein OmpA-like peptidoglycan-associated protein